MTDYTVGDTVNYMFTTRRFSTGAPYTLAGTPAISAYEDNSTTQITAGITLTADFDAVTGLNHVAVVASGANGFEAGKDYHLVITTGTVDSVSVVGEVVGRFTLSRSAAAVDLANGTDGLGAIKTDTAAILVDTGTTLDGRIPAALVGGRMDASVGAVAANAITAAGIADGAIDAATFAAGAIDAAAIAADAIDASALATDAVNEIADGILNRDMSTGTDSGSPTVRTVRQALRFLRNKWSIAAGTLTVTKEDDTTASWTSTVAGTAGADPITSSDPA